MLYRPIAHAWAIYDNSGDIPRPMKSAKRKTESKEFVEGVGRALRRAAKVARKVAKAYGTPIYVWENGKVVAKKP